MPRVAGLLHLQPARRAACLPLRALAGQALHLRVRRREALAGPLQQLALGGDAPLQLLHPALALGRLLPRLVLACARLAEPRLHLGAPLLRGGEA